MNRRVTLTIIIVIFCIYAPLSLHGKKQIPVIQELTHRISDPSIPVEGTTLQDIAVVAYQVLIDVPFTGVQDSQAAIEELIVLKSMLIAHSGMLERLLALRMQEAIDCALLAEVNRRAMFLNGETVTPPYTANSVMEETITLLLEQNAIAEAEQAQYILHLNGMFARFCQQKHFTVDDVLTGKVMRSLPSDLEKRVSYVESFFLRTMDEKTMRDFLFVYTLEVIDRARDVRILWEVFRQEKDFYLTGTIATKTERIGKVLASSHSSRRYISTGERKTAGKIALAGSFCHSPTFPGHYPERLTIFFSPYFRDMEAIVANNPGIFSWYCESRGLELTRLLQARSGEWLELEE